MNEGNLFLNSLEKNAAILGKTARQICVANNELCSWVLDPLAKWSRMAYGDSIFDDAARGYTEYCINVGRAQNIYEKNGKYMPELLSKIKEAVYDDEKYMIPYMWAAILIYPFWPAMVNHLGFYRDEFLNKLPEKSNVLELACGHGVMGLLAAEHRSDILVDGLDISEHAVRIANKLRDVSGHKSRVSFTIKDILKSDAKDAVYQGIIAAMLAEHLNEPQILLSMIKNRLAPNGIVYFSTALESFQRDHVYEFNNESEPIIMAEKAGLRVIKLICDGTKKNKNQKFNPRALAMILVHK
jgi:2-polyprenyl-3-methyl-5-hydroxy-6-metoxy-1,4-benzoquinol methylase